MKFTGGPLEGYVSPPEQDAEIGEEWTYRGLDAQEHTYRREGDGMTFVESVPAAAPAIASAPTPEPEPVTVEWPDGPPAPPADPKPEPDPAPEEPPTPDPIPDAAEIAVPDEDLPTPDDRQASDAPE